jgi:archaetidylinositol phosphate synthase
LLNKLRDSLEPSLTKLGKSFASTGLSANFWTALSLILSILAGVAYSSNSFNTSNGGGTAFSAAVLGGVLLLLSGFFDIVDGTVARVTNQRSKKGAFLDSCFDKVAEVAIFTGISYGKLADPLLSLVCLGISLIVSYTRAKAESLGVQLQGIGLGERAERILIIALVGMLPAREAMEWAVVIVSIIAGITTYQRMAVISRRLSSI